MTTPTEAIAAIRSAVQDYGDEHTVIGRPADIDAVRWVGRLLKWEWPRDYLEVLSKHNGAQVGLAILHSFLSSFEIFLVYRDDWYEPKSFWPIADDECGNYWTLDLGRLEPSQSICPVVFFDHEQSYTEPVDEFESYSAFVVQLMRGQMQNGNV